MPKPSPAAGPPAAPAAPTPEKRPGAMRSLAQAMTSWRTASVTLMSFASGMPLGLVWLAIPDWMRDIGVDIRIVGLLTLAQVPWTFKFLWSPLMDRYVPPRLGPKDIPVAARGRQCVCASSAEMTAGEELPYSKKKPSLSFAKSLLISATAS